MEMTYLRRVCGVARRDGESSERCGMRSHASGVNCGVVEWVTRNTVKEYMCKRGAARGGGLDQARRECFESEKWRDLLQWLHTVGRPWRVQTIRTVSSIVVYLSLSLVIRGKIQHNGDLHPIFAF